MLATRSWPKLVVRVVESSRFRSWGCAECSRNTTQIVSIKRRVSCVLRAAALSRGPSARLARARGTRGYASWRVRALIFGWAQPPATAEGSGAARREQRSSAMERQRRPPLRLLSCARSLYCVGRAPRAMRHRHAGHGSVRRKTRRQLRFPAFCFQLPHGGGGPYKSPARATTAATDKAAVSARAAAETPRPSKLARLLAAARVAQSSVGGPTSPVEGAVSGPASHKWRSSWTWQPCANRPATSDPRSPMSVSCGALPANARCSAP